jgi:hypothetical protein
MEILPCYNGREACDMHNCSANTGNDYAEDPSHIRCQCDVIVAVIAAQGMVNPAAVEAKREREAEEWLNGVSIV